MKKQDIYRRILHSKDNERMNAALLVIAGFWGAVIIWLIVEYAIASIH